MGYTVRVEPTGPNVTTFRIGVADGDRIIRTGTITPPQPDPPPVVVTDDTDVWTVNGPPPATPPPGMEPGDTWIDVASGDVFVLDE